MIAGSECRSLAIRKYLESLYYHPNQTDFLRLIRWWRIVFKKHVSFFAWSVLLTFLESVKSLRILVSRSLLSFDSSEAEHYADVARGEILRISTSVYD